MELTGERKFGGLYGFVGNTCKIVNDSNSKLNCSLVGGGFADSGKLCPLASVDCIDYPDMGSFYSVGLLELKN